MALKVIFIMGLPGTGKTYLAKLLSSHTKAKHISSDLVRKELGKSKHYSPKDKQEVYEEMQTRMRKALVDSSDVVVDTTFYSASLRHDFEQLALKFTKEIYWILTVADENTIKKRVSAQRPDSEADYQVFLKIKDQWDEVSRPHLCLATDSQSADHLLDKVLTYCNFR